MQISCVLPETGNKGTGKDVKQMDAKKHWPDRKERHISVRLEILSVFLLFVTIIMGVSLIIYTQNINELRQADIDHLTESGRRLSLAADDIITDLGPLFSIQYEDRKLRYILRNRRGTCDERIRFQNTVYVENTLAHAMADNEYIIRICLFTARGDVYSNVSSVGADYRACIRKTIRTGEIGRNLYYMDERTWRIGQVNRRVVTAIKVLYEYNGVTPLAWLTMDINCEMLEELLHASDPETGTLLLCGDKILYMDRAGKISEEELQEIRRNGIRMAEEGREQEIICTDGKNYLTTACVCRNTGWIVVRYVMEREALQAIARRQKRDIMILLTTAVLVFFFYHYRINEVMAPLVRMDRVVRYNQGEALQKVLFSPGEDRRMRNNEIGNVVRNYNAMVDRVNEYAQKTLKYEISQKEAQLKMLTYQINPHFLYNTLNTISAMAEIENMHDIVLITDCISNIFRYSLKGESQVSLREELEHVKDYVQIQMFRFPGRFHAKYRVPEALLECRVIKFILQPIVENSITHGLFNRTEGGIISIGAEVEKEKVLLLTVSDNGVGIAPEELEEIHRRMLSWKLQNGGERKNGADGIGIKNVNARIMGYYGDDYGIRIYSEYGKGTKTVLRLGFGQESHEEMEERRRM